MAGMTTFWRISASLLCALCGFALAFIVGFYLSFLFGANIHDEMPGVFGLGPGITGGIASFEFVRKKLTKPLK
jgi:hypothetical protein